MFNDLERDEDTSLGKKRCCDWLVFFVPCPATIQVFFSIWYEICALRILAFSCYVQYFCTVFLSSFVWRQLMNGTHKHIVIIPGLHMITWWSRMNALFSAENLNCIFMQIPWKRMLFYGQTQKMQLSCHVVQTKSYKPCDCELHAHFWFCTKRLFEPIR